MWRRSLQPGWPVPVIEAKSTIFQRLQSAARRRLLCVIKTNEASMRLMIYCFDLEKLNLKKPVRLSVSSARQVCIWMCGVYFKRSGTV